MIKAIIMIDQNESLIDWTLDKNSPIISAIKPELNYVTSMIKNGDILVDEQTFWIVFIKTIDENDFKNKKVFITTKKSWTEIQTTNPSIALPSNVEVLTDINSIVTQYQKPATKDLYLCGSVKKMNQYCAFADEIIMIRTKQLHKNSSKFHQIILKNFIHKRTQTMTTFQVENYQQLRTNEIYNIK